MSAALLLIDLVNPMEFVGGDALFRNAIPAVRRIAALKRRARAAGLPVIYANDNFDAWHLGFRELVDEIRGRSPNGAMLIDQLRPDPSADHFVLKPMHSAFFQTALEFLLQQLEATTLILTGVATEACVLFTANDAYMRRYEVVVPRDCVASERNAERVHALRLMARLLHADVRPGDQIDVSRLAPAHPDRVPLRDRRSA